MGIYSGAFDPVHAGHVAFALRAAKRAKLDRVYVMPEREPRGKQSEHYGHRVAMIRRALRPYKHTAVLETVERRFTARRTLARLRQRFPSAQLVFLLGSDSAKGIGSWPHVEELMRQSEVCVALRRDDSEQDAIDIFSGLSVPPQRLWLMESSERHVSSSAIRVAIGTGKTALGMLKSVYNYARREWLYTHSSHN